MPLTLDTLLARATKSKRTVSAPIPIAATLAEIDRVRRAALVRSIPADPETPRALVLITVTTTCLNCGTAYEHPNQNLLVRYDNRGLSNSTKYTKRDVEPFLGLPRERKHINQTTPFCDRCF